jgi:arsenate reductase-like glutaredoxin family protein
LLASLTSLTSSKVKFDWLSNHQLAFDKIKKVIETEVLLSYPDFDKLFHIYTDASDHQLSAFIMKDKKLIAFYSRKISAAQRRYFSTERELSLLLKHARNIRKHFLITQLRSSQSIKISPLMGYKRQIVFHAVTYCWKNMG